jgi:hypothetical protein
LQRYSIHQLENPFMSINTLISTSLSGMQTGMNRVAIASGRISLNPSDNSSLANALVDQIAGSHQVKLSANVIQAADEMLGSIIDVTA